MDKVALLANGPEDGRTVVLAHGAAVPMSSPFMTFFAKGLADKGFRVIRFEFPYMQAMRQSGQRRPPDKPQVLLNQWGAVIRHLGGPENLIIGGKSMGGRMATMVAAGCQKMGTPVKGLAVLGFPFHGQGKPDQPRLDALRELNQPVLIMQGSRDPMGSRETVDGYNLSENVVFHWLEDGDHDFKPRVSSGQTADGNWQSALEVFANYAEGCWLTES